MDYIYDLVTQMGKRSILIDRRPLVGKRAYKLYQYLKKTNSPSPVGEAAVLGCTVGGAVHRRTLRYLEIVLINNLMALRPGEMTSGELEDTRKYIWKLIAIGRRQAFKSDSVLVVPYLKEAFHLAEDNGLVFPAKISSEMLALMLAHLHFDEKEYLFYQKKADYYRGVNYELQKSIICYRKLAYLKSIGEKTSELIKVGRGGLESLENREQRFDHLALSVMEYQIKIKISEIENAPSGVIEHALSALRFLKARSENTREVERAFTTYLGYSYLLTNNYQEGSALISSLLSKPETSGQNFGKLLEIEVLLSLRTGHYREASRAYVAFSRAVSDLENVSLFDRSSSLFEAYLFLLDSLTIISLNDDTPCLSLKSMRRKLELLAKSLDNVDNTHYLIVSLMEEIGQGNFRKARDHWRSMPVPKQSNGIRYKYFYSLLSIVFEQGFHRLAVERHAEKYLKKFKSKPFEGELAVSLEEIIPYEKLWHLLLDLLENKRIKLR